LDHTPLELRHFCLICDLPVRAIESSRRPHSEAPRRELLLVVPVSQGQADRRRR